MHCSIKLFLCLLILPAPTHASTYNDRTEFEAAIEIFYTEGFESLAGPATNHGRSLTLPSGLRADVLSNDGPDLHSVPAGWVGPRGPLTNTSTTLGDFNAQDLSRPGVGFQLDLGRQFEAIGFDFFANGDITNPNIGVDFQFEAFNSTLGSTLTETLVGQFGASIGTRNNTQTPLAGFFGFINDGNPLDVFDPVTNPSPMENGILKLVQRPEAAFDQIFIRNFDGSGKFEFIDNVVVGNRRNVVTPPAIPLPASGILLLAGLAVLAGSGRRFRRA